MIEASNESNGQSAAAGSVSHQNTCSNFSVGDKVVVDLEIDLLKTMQEGHGGWNAKMSEVGVR